jgi:hypothetical protein
MWRHSPLSAGLGWQVSKDMLAMLTAGGRNIGSIGQIVNDKCMKS